MQKSLTLNKTCFENFLEENKKSGKWTISRKTARQKESGLYVRQKNEREDRKEESNDSPEIPDGGGVGVGGGGLTLPASLQRI